VRVTVLWGAATFLALGCGQTPDIVTARLVDPQESQGWPGVRSYLVQVHRTPMAPFSGLERLWRRSHADRVDTVPGVRAVGTVTVVGDNQVMGFHGEVDGGATIFQYDAFSHTLRQVPLPSWFRDAVLNPPPEFAPGGRHVIFLARSPDGMMRAEVHSWPDGAPVVVGLPVRPNPQASRSPVISWGNATDFLVSLPVVSDTGPIWLLSQGRLTGGSGQIDSATRYLDVKLPPSARGLRPSALPGIPPALRAELDRRGCTVPQSHRGENLIQGHFGASGQTDWAALCSSRSWSTILVYWGGAAQCAPELRRAPDLNYQTRVGEHTAFTRSIHTTARYQVHDAAGRPVLPERFVDLEHEAIEDLNEGWGSTVWSCQGGKWIELPGSGSQKTRVLQTR